MFLLISRAAGELKGADLIRGAPERGCGRFTGRPPAAPSAHGVQPSAKLDYGTKRDVPTYRDSDSLTTLLPATLFPLHISSSGWAARRLAHRTRESRRWLRWIDAQRISILWLPSPIHLVMVFSSFGSSAILKPQSRASCLFAVSHQPTSHADMAFEIFPVPHDDEIARAWQHRVKEFRLLALKTAPDAFLTTYAEAAAYPDDLWLSRLTNPEAVTFLALQESRIVGSLTLIGPLPYLAEDHSPRDNPWNPPAVAATSPAKERAAVSHWRINGMFVHPEARRQGIAKAIIEKSMAFAREQAALSGKEFVASIAVDDDNPAAKNLYKTCGFVTIRSETEPGATRSILLQKYMPRVAKTA